MNNRQNWYRNEYLKSGHWQIFRRKALQNRAFTCENCGERQKPLDVHHLTYKNLWNEQLEDVEVLCRKCHNKKHHKSIFNIILIWLYRKLFK